MGQTNIETEDPTRAVGVDAGERLRLCGRFTNGIDAKSRVVMPSAFRAPFTDKGFLTPWRGSCLAGLTTAELDVWAARLAHTLVDADESEAARVMDTFWSSTVSFTLDVQGRLVLAEEVRSQVGITDEVRFQGRGRWVELWPGQVTPEELDERADHLRTLAAVQAAYIPEIES